MTVAIGIGTTPLVLSSGQYATITASANAVGTLQVPGASVQTISAGASYVFGGYAQNTPVIVNLSQGAVSVDYTSPVPQAKSFNLTGDYTLSAADDGTYFTASATCTVTVPAGLNPMPQCVFAPPASGSITLSPTGGATLNGSTSPVIVNLTTNPVPAGLARTSVTDNYGVTTAGQAWTTLTGLPSDNSAWNTAMQAYQAAIPGGTKQTGAYTIQPTDSNGFLWLAAQSADKAFTLPATGIPPNFRVRLGYLNNSAAAGRLKLIGGGAAAFNWCASAASGVLLSATTIYIGTASTNNIAVVDVVHEGSAPGNTFFVVPLMGAVAAS